MRRLHKLFALPPPERAVFLRCALTLAAVLILLRLTSYKVAHGVLAHSRKEPVADGPSPAAIMRNLKRAAKAVPANCLPQALAAQYLLHRAGVATTIRVGVAAKVGGGLLAHAWLLEGERVLLGGTAEELRPYTCLTDLTFGAA